MGKLHEILAVEQDRKKQALNIITEAIRTFRIKDAHFEGFSKEYTPMNVEEDSTKIPTESKVLVTTVKEKLSYVFSSITNALDTILTKEQTNSGGEVSANLNFNGLDFGKFSATSLLALEKFLLNLRPMLKILPTLDPNINWINNDSVRKDTWKTEGTIQYRQIKKTVPITLAESTDKHKAQAQLVSAQLVSKDVQVGYYTTVQTSGKITPQMKSDILAKFDKLIDEIKLARSKANQVEVKPVKKAKDILGSLL